MRNENSLKSKMQLFKPVNTNCAVSKKVGVKLLDAEAMAAESFISEGFEEEVTQEQVDTAKKTSTLYNTLKSIVPVDMQSVLYDLNEAYGNQIYVEAKKSYIEGYRNALKAIGSSDKSNV